MVTLGVGVALAVGAGLAAVVYRDAGRIGLSPFRWAGLVFVSVAGAAAFRVLVPDVPVPGLLVIAILGPAVYLLERDDTVHDDTADPTTLPDQAGGSHDDDNE